MHARPGAPEDATALDATAATDGAHADDGGVSTAVAVARAAAVARVAAASGDSLLLPSPPPPLPEAGRWPPLAAACFDCRRCHGCTVCEHELRSKRQVSESG